MKSKKALRLFVAKYDFEPERSLVLGKKNDEILCFGVTEEGNSVCVLFSHFKPTLTLKLPPDVLALTRAEIDQQFLEMLEEVQGLVKHFDVEKDRATFFFHSHEGLLEVQRALTSKFRANQQEPEFDPLPIPPPFSWVEFLRPEFVAAEQLKVSFCQLELKVSNNAPWRALPPRDSPGLRIMTLDIECLAPKDSFPKHDSCPVIQIAVMVRMSNEEAPFIRVVFSN